MKRVILFRDSLCARGDCSYAITVDDECFEETMSIIDECIGDGDDDYKTIENELAINGIDFDYISTNIDEIRNVRC